MTIIERLLALARLTEEAGDPVTPLAVRAAVLSYGGAETPARGAAALLWLAYIQGRFIAPAELAPPRRRA